MKNERKLLKNLAAGADLASRRLNSAVEVLSVFFLSTLVLVVGLKIIARYIAVYPMPWTEETAKFLLTWSVVLGSASPSKEESSWPAHTCSRSCRIPSCPGCSA